MTDGVVTGDVFATSSVAILHAPDDGAVGPRLATRSAVLERRGSVAALIDGEGDGWYTEPGIVIWRIGNLDGASLWGHVAAAQTDVAFGVVRAYLERPARVHDVVTDLAGVSSIDSALYPHVAAYLGDLVPRIVPRVRRHVVVVPDGVVGCAAAGILHLRAVHRWQVVAELGAAVSATVAARVTGLVAHLRAGDLVTTLRTHVASSPDATLASAARALGVSTRSLQRALAGDDTSFRAVADQARIANARRLLEETDLKVEAIARDVGFASLSGFVRAFRRHVGHSPHEHRRARAA